jgi:hypothetical protein
MSTIYVPTTKSERAEFVKKLNADLAKSAKKAGPQVIESCESDETKLFNKDLEKLRGEQHITSTQVPGTIAKEDQEDIPDNKMTEAMMLNNDLKKLRSELQTTRIDNY